MTDILDEEVWSWSKINSFREGLNGNGCLYAWWITYREGDRGVGNYFSEFGSLVHNIIEKYNKGELFDWEIKDVLLSGLKNIEYPPPSFNIGKSYENKIKEFFCIDDLNGEDFSSRFQKFKFIESELEFLINIGGYKVTGFIDAIAEHEDLGFIVMDYKSSKPYTGEVLKNNIMQMYLYSIAVKNKYGKYPDYLIYYYFKEDEREFPYKFSLTELDRTKNYVLETIELTKGYIEKDQFIPRCLTVSDNDFFCNHLCNHRFSCDYSKLLNSEA